MLFGYCRLTDLVFPHQSIVQLDQRTRACFVRNLEKTQFAVRRILLQLHICGERR